MSKTSRLTVTEGSPVDAARHRHRVVQRRLRPRRRPSPGRTPPTGSPGPGEYHVSGVTASGHATSATIVVTQANLLRNPGFEDADISMWTTTGAGAHAARDRRSAQRAPTRRTSTRRAAYSFTLSQTVTGPRRRHATSRAPRCRATVRMPRAPCELVAVERRRGDVASAPFAMTGWRSLVDPDDGRRHRRRGRHRHGDASRRTSRPGHGERSTTSSSCARSPPGADTDRPRGRRRARRGARPRSVFSAASLADARPRGRDRARSCSAPRAPTQARCRRRARPS